MFLTFVDLLGQHLKKYYIRKSQHQVILRGEKEPGTSKFAKYLKSSYKVLRKNDTPYVPIPEFRDEVCRQLRISTFTFDKKMKTFPSTYNGMRILYATPIKRVRDGLIIGDKYYYFIALFLHRE